VAVVVGVLAGAAVLAMNHNSSSAQATAQEDVRLASADAACAFVPCTVDGLTPGPSADAYPQQQLAWIQSYQFANAVSRVPGSPHLTPQQISKSVTVLPLGAASRRFKSCWWASHCAAISFRASSAAVASAMVRRYAELYVLWSNRLDHRQLTALAVHGKVSGRSARKALDEAIQQSRVGGVRPILDRVNGATTLPRTYAVTATAGQTRRHVAELAAAAALASAMILLGAFGLVDARRRGRSRTEQDGPARAAAHRPTLG
jgi:hypothetical protein